MRKLELWVCGGGSVSIKYAYGYWTGLDNDLLCVVNGISNSKVAEESLSPVSQFRCLAFIWFLWKRIIKQCGFKFSFLYYWMCRNINYKGGDKMKKPKHKFLGRTWVGWLNILLLQWFFIRLGYSKEWKLLRWVVPWTGWWSDYIWVKKKV